MLVASDSLPTSRHDMLFSSFQRCLNYGLRTPSLQELGVHFPGLPVPVVAALLDLYLQVLSHIRSHSLEEFKDICREYGMDAKLAALEQMCAATQPTNATEQSGSVDMAAAVQGAETAARMQAMGQEATHLQAALTQAVACRDQLRQVVNQKRAAAQQLAEAYKSLGTDVQQVYEASKLPPGSP
ncbi:hypothetical protein V8C86DRAFT_2476377 [Haematococcus lacustris]